MIGTGLNWLLLQGTDLIVFRNLIKEIYKKAFGSELELQNPRILISEKLVVVGDEILTRNQHKGESYNFSISSSKTSNDDTVFTIFRG